MKKYVFGILAVAMAVGFSAFIIKKAHKRFTTFILEYQRAKDKIPTGFANSLVQASFQM